ncbi:MAG: sulfur oxidation c-type cytochrome SoxA [Piscirickettsiaceae bacterium]|nr:MAG: sulfur oxidation c-type cytochrome SoxA [Piscirickettsiaceae bacterium]PCI66144.1 MAG: sulfur oxidation c-type cytochrome SoxA [Piscirickettsiaceae bacterium]
MKNVLNSLLTVLLLVSVTVVYATPGQDKETFQRFYSEHFPDIAIEDFADGVYALDQDARDQWQAMNDFPPYEDDLGEGQELFNTAFANGKNYASCFKNKGENIRQYYPKFDSKRKMVITLELAINECRIKNGEEPLPYLKGEIAKISAYMASTSEDSIIEIVTPASKDELAAYQAGKQYFYSKRGQLNFSCANCHVQNVGRKARSETLSPALGHPTHFPVYRLKWANFGTLHRRFVSCNKQVRAQPLTGQSEAYRNLEYFLTYMSNGLPINGPASRK